jgi:hypothetical protein
VPNTAFGSTGGGQPLNVPVELMILVYLASLGGLPLGNVKAVRRRRYPVRAAGNLSRPHD